jgi:2-dehydro-3-deoxyphosphogluconate aldolase/(4S)-4-hydroxy-2-oxoglutarate aldolase|tara:strand:+ start:4690 stop:5286 length:597 start_codon:yes stop_codon:yes gene_type:complete
MIKILSNIKVLPVLEIESHVDPEKLIGSLIDGNINVIEVTLRNEMGLKHIEQIRNKFPEIKVGAGTVLNIKQLILSIKSGAQFAVSPGYDLELALKAKELRFPYLPGVSSPSDIMSLFKINFNVFKFFPANALGGISYLKSLSGPFPKALFCPTGGINEMNYKQWIAEKNVICVGGTWLAPKGSNDYKEITKKALKIN